MAHKQLFTDDIESVNLRIDGEPWHLLQARTELSTAATPDYVDLVLAPTSETVETLPDNPTLTEEEGGLLGTEFILEIDTELSAGPRDSEETKIFTGNLANLSLSGQGAWEAIAWDPSHQAFASGEGSANSGNFLNSQIKIPAATEAPDVADGTISSGPARTIEFPKESHTTPAATHVRATDVVEQIIDQSPLDPFQVETHFAESPGVRVGTQPDGTVIYGGVDRLMFFSNEYIKVSEALERIELSTNSTWWFDREGVFHIGAPTPGNPVESFSLEFITDTSAGKSSPAWQGVQVIGSGVVSEDGWNRTNMNSSNLSTSSARLSDDGKVDTGKLSEPVFTYRNLEIQTQAEADAVAKEIVNKLQKQQADGTVTVVGFPEIRPFDAIQLPDTNEQPMGGDRFTVQKVVHKINPSDGFLTDIHVGGLTRETSTVYNEDIEFDSGGGGGTGSGSEAIDAGGI